MQALADRMKGIPRNQLMMHDLGSPNLPHRNEYTTGSHLARSSAFPLASIRLRIAG